MASKEPTRFVVSASLDVVFEDAGKSDPTGILRLRLLSDGRSIAEVPILHAEVPRLLQALSSAALAIESKGERLTAYHAGYNDAKEGRPPELTIKWPSD